MRSKNKISIIVIIQILLIILSFSVIAYFENAETYIGNTINVAGKNRYLAMVAHDKIENAISSRGNDDPMKSFDVLESNMQLLKNGGIDDNLTLQPLHERFIHEYFLLENKFNEYENLAKEVLDIQSISNSVPVEKLKELDTTTNDFVFQADVLVDKLSIAHKTQEDRFVILQVLLLFTNLGIHLFMIYLIIHIFKNESEKMLKLEKLGGIGELSARIAHDLRNPLSNIKMSLELIKHKENFSDSTSKKITIIDKAVNRMTHQIDDVMNYVRTSPLFLSDVKLVDIIESALARLYLPNNVNVNYDKSNISIKCDREKITIVFINLIDNAVNAMGEKGEINISAVLSSTTVNITISNSGPPIESAHLDKIFEPLFTTHEKGTGLGLATCQNIISQHKGTIYAANNPTRFVIILPKS